MNKVYASAAEAMAGLVKDGQLLMAGGFGVCLREELFRDHTASDAVARISRWIGLLVIGFGMHHNGRAPVAEEGMAVAAKIDVLVFNLEMRFAVCACSEVGVVAGVVAFRIFQAMFLSIGIEMRRPPT